MACFTEYLKRKEQQHHAQQRAKRINIPHDQHLCARLSYIEGGLADVSSAAHTSTAGLAAHALHAPSMKNLSPLSGMIVVCSDNR